MFISALLKDFMTSEVCVSIPFSSSWRAEGQKLSVVSAFYSNCCGHSLIWKLSLYLTLHLDPTFYKAVSNPVYLWSPSTQSLVWGQDLCLLDFGWLSFFFSFGSLPCFLAASFSAFYLLLAQDDQYKLVLLKCNVHWPPLTFALNSWLLSWA